MLTPKYNYRSNDFKFGGTTSFDLYWFLIHESCLYIYIYIYIIFCATESRLYKLYIKEKDSKDETSSYYYSYTIPLQIIGFYKYGKNKTQVTNAKFIATFKAQRVIALTITTVFVNYLI